MIGVAADESVVSCHVHSAIAGIARLSMIGITKQIIAVVISELWITRRAMIALLCDIRAKMRDIHFSFASNHVS